MVFPIFMAVHMSLYHNVLIKPQEYAFIGLGNYMRLMRDEVFWLSLWNSLDLGVRLGRRSSSSAALRRPCSCTRPSGAAPLVRTLTLLPWIIPGIVVALVWEWLYQPNYGVINDLLIRARLAAATVWPGFRTRGWPCPLSSPPSLAGHPLLRDHAAGRTAGHPRRDLRGGPRGRRHRGPSASGTSPCRLLRPIIVVATATRIIWTFNYADLIFVMTGGGPANATQITSTYTLLQAYSNLDFGYAATLSIVLLIIMLAFTVAICG